MFGGHFYHGTIRKSVIIFGTLFNDISIKKYDADGVLLKEIPVPLSYGPREKYLSRVNASENPLTMPRMSFTLLDLVYDGERRLGKTDRITKEVQEDTKSKMKVFNPVPYNLNFQLTAMVKNSDDGIQIVEQILPFFAPSFSISFDIIPGMEISKDVDIILNSITQEDTYEGDFDTRRVLTWTFDFTLKTYLYGPVREEGVILKSISDIYDATKDYSSSNPLTRQTVTPDTFDKDDNFTFGDAIQDFPESK